MTTESNHMEGQEPETQVQGRLQENGDGQVEGQGHAQQVPEPTG